MLFQRHLRSCRQGYNRHPKSGQCVYLVGVSALKVEVGAGVNVAVGRGDECPIVVRGQDRSDIGLCAGDRGAELLLVDLEGPIRQADGVQGGRGVVLVDRVPEQSVGTVERVGFPGPDHG